MNLITPLIKIRNYSSALIIALGLFAVVIATFNTAFSSSEVNASTSDFYTENIGITVQDSSYNPVRSGIMVDRNIPYIPVSRSRTTLKVYDYFQSNDIKNRDLKIQLHIGLENHSADSFKNSLVEVVEVNEELVGTKSFTNLYSWGYLIDEKHCDGTDKAIQAFGHFDKDRIAKYNLSELQYIGLAIFKCNPPSNVTSVKSVESIAVEKLGRKVSIDGKLILEESGIKQFDVANYGEIKFYKNLPQGYDNTHLVENFIGSAPTKRLDSSFSLQNKQDRVGFLYNYPQSECSGRSDMITAFYSDAFANLRWLKNVQIQCDVLNTNFVGAVDQLEGALVLGSVKDVNNADNDVTIEAYIGRPSATKSYEETDVKVVSLKSSALDYDGNYEPFSDSENRFSFQIPFNYCGSGQEFKLSVYAVDDNTEEKKSLFSNNIRCQYNRTPKGRVETVEKIGVNKYKFTGYSYDPDSLQSSLNVGVKYSPNGNYNEVINNTTTSIERSDIAASSGLNIGKAGWSITLDYNTCVGEQDVYFYFNDARLNIQAASLREKVSFSCLETNDNPDLVFDSFSSYRLPEKFNGVAVREANILDDVRYKYYGTADFNNDGISDYIVENGDNDNVEVIMLDSKGFEIQRSTVSDSVDFRLDIVNTGDVNDDGIDDLIWRHRNSGDLIVWILNSDYSLKSSILAGANYGSEWKNIGFDDTTNKLYLHKLKGDSAGVVESLKFDSNGSVVARNFETFHGVNANIFGVDKDYLLLHDKNYVYIHNMTSKVQKGLVSKDKITGTRIGSNSDLAYQKGYIYNDTIFKEVGYGEVDLANESIGLVQILHR